MGVWSSVKNADWQSSARLALFSCVRMFNSSLFWGSLLVFALVAPGFAATASEPDAPAQDDAALPPEATPETTPGAESTKRRLHSIARELNATAKRHGPDSVTLQVGLLVHTLNAGAIGASEVTVVGESSRAGPSYLELDVLTGIIFDVEGSTSSSQLAHLWKQIAVPALEGMDSFKFEPSGVEIVFFYGLQRFAEILGHKADPEAPAEARAVRIAIPEDVLADLAAGAAEAEDVLGRCVVRDAEAASSAPH